MSDFYVVIPARYASTRLPGKPLLEIAGRPMLAHVYEQACKSQARQVLIATDDERIAEVARALRAQVLMTRADHLSGTDRLQEVAAHMGWDDDCCVVNVQGDEPLLPPVLIDQVAANLMARPQVAVATLCEPIESWAELHLSQVVKVVRDAQGMATYFSRSPIPYLRDSHLCQAASPPPGLYHRHLGLYAYRVGFLHDYVRWPQADTELAESLEQLRALYQGARIHVDRCAQPLPAGVDTEADLQRVRALLEGGA